MNGGCPDDPPKPLNILITRYRLDFEPLIQWNRVRLLLRSDFAGIHTAEIYCISVAKSDVDHEAIERAVQDVTPCSPTPYNAGGPSHDGPPAWLWRRRCAFSSVSQREMSALDREGEAQSEPFRGSFGNGPALRA